MSKGGSNAPPPDPRLVDAQIQSMGIQDAAIQQMLANSNEMLPLQKERLQFGLDASKTAYAQSQEDREFSLGRRMALSGLQDTMIADAKDFDVTKRGQELAGRGIAAVNQQFSNTTRAAERDLNRMGVNPNSGKYVSMYRQMALDQALAQVTADTQGRAQARQEGYALTDRAANALSGFPSLGMQASAAGAQQATGMTSLLNSGLAGMNSGYGAAAGAAGQSGQNAAAMYGAQSKAFGENYDPTGDYVKLAGTVAAIFASSDRRLKRDIKRIGTTRGGHALYRFRYLWSDEPCIGVMADEVAHVPGAVLNVGGFDMVDYACLN